MYPPPGNGYPPLASGGSLAGFSAPGSAGQLQAGSDGANKVEAEIEAERLWWSEVSERQVKELESSFGVEFQKTTDKLRSDIARMQDRLELLVETERKQRQAAVVDLKGEVATQQAQMAESALSEIKSLKADLLLQERPTISAESASATAELWSALESTRTELSARFATLQAELEQTRAEARESSEDKALMADLRGEMQEHKSAVELQAIQTKDLRRDLNSLMERTQLMAQSNEEVHQLHQVIMQSVSDLSSSIEEVSTATFSTEQALRQEIQATRVTLDAGDSKMRADLLEALEISGSKIMLSLADEQEQRALEANILRTRLDAAYGRLDDMQASNTVADVARDTPVIPSVEPVQVEALRTLLDLTRADLSRLESQLGESQAEQIGMRNDTRRHAEELMSSLRSQTAEGLAEERKTCVQDIEEMRRYLEDMVKRLRQASLEASGGSNRSPDETSQVTNVALADAASLRDLQDLRAEFSTLKANLQVVDSECRRGTAAATRAEAEMLNLEGEARKSAAVLPRVAALEEVCRKHTSVARKVETIEADMRQVAHEPELRRLEAEMRRTAHEVVPLASRIDAIEAEVRKTNREAFPVQKRLDVHESNLQVVSENMALVATNLDTMQVEVKEVALGLLGLKKGFEGQLHTQAVDMKLDHLAQELQAMDAQSPTRQTIQMGQVLAPVAGSAPPAAVVAAAPRGRSTSCQRPAALAIAPSQEGLQASGRSVQQARTPPIQRDQVRAGSPVPMILPTLSDDLKNSIENLVFKVNKTLTKPGEPQAALQDTRASLENSQGAGQEGFMQALQAVQELRQRNLELREGNADIVEELLVNENMMDGPADRSLGPSPNAHLQPTAQFNSAMAGLRATLPGSMHLQVGQPAAQLQVSSQQRINFQSSMPSAAALRQPAALPPAVGNYAQVRGGGSLTLGAYPARR